MLARVGMLGLFKIKLEEFGLAYLRILSLDLELIIAQRVKVTNDLLTSSDNGLLSVLSC